MLPHGRDLRLAFTVRVAFRTPRVSGTGDAHCISRGFTLLSKCVMQRMRAWSLPALLFLSEPVCRSVGRRPEARAHGGKATRPHPLRHPSRRISLGSRRSSARCARTAPDSPFRVVSACHSPRPTNKVDASRRAEKCRSLRVKVEVGVSGCALRPILPSAPYSLPPHTRFRPILASARTAPGSLPPQARFRPILPSAPASRPPHPPVRPCLRFRPSLPSAPCSLPPQPPFRPSLPSASGRPWMLIG
jgi:hypothetical protein